MLEALALSLLIRQQLFQNSLSANGYVYDLQMKINFLPEGELIIYGGSLGWESQIFDSKKLGKFCCC